MCVHARVRASSNGPYVRDISSTLVAFWCVGSLHCRAACTPSLVRRELFSLSDGGQLYLDWCDNSYDERTQTDSDLERPTVIILPGITGEGSVHLRVDCVGGEGYRWQ